MQDLEKIKIFQKTSIFQRTLALVGVQLLSDNSLNPHLIFHEFLKDEELTIKTLSKLLSELIVIRTTKNNSKIVESRFKAIELFFTNNEKKLIFSKMTYYALIIGLLRSCSNWVKFKELFNGLTKSSIIFKTKIKE